MKEDYIKKLGCLAIANRFKRISETMVLSGRKLYKLLDIDIEPNWFLVFRLLQNNRSMSVTEIAKSLNFSHPSVITLTNKMLKKGYLKSYRDNLDNRKLMLELTDKSKSIMPRLEEIWEAFENAIIKMLDDEYMLMSILDKIESDLKENNLMNRVLNELK